MDQTLERPSSPKMARGKEKAEIMEESQTTNLGISNAEWIAEMTDKSRKARELSILEEESITRERREASIFRVPAQLQVPSPEHFQPKVVAIGPYHRQNSNLPIKDEHKLFCVDYFITKRSLNLEKWLCDMKSREQEARGYYSEKVNSMNSKSFLEMLLLDSCFIYLVFEFINSFEGTFKKLVPSFCTGWGSDQVMLDLLMLENQIPFFVLVELEKMTHNITTETDDISTSALRAIGSLRVLCNRHPSIYSDRALHLLHLFRLSLHLDEVKFGGRTIPIDDPTVLIDDQAARMDDTSRSSPTHFPGSVSFSLHSILRTLFGSIQPQKLLLLLHLVRISADPSENKCRDDTSCQIPTHVPSATELQDRSAMKFKKITADSFLDIRFHNGVMEIPFLALNDYSNTLFHNLIAFEQGYPFIQSCVTTYAAFMNCLINKERDVELLEGSGILLNMLPTNRDVPLFFNKLSPRAEFITKGSYLALIYEDVNKYHNKKRNKWFADLKLNYFSNPWVTLSVASAAALLILTFMQTYYAAITYYHR